MPPSIPSGPLIPITTMVDRMIFAAREARGNLIFGVWVLCPRESDLNR
jgi:hypothetical protein